MGITTHFPMPEWDIRCPWGYSNQARAGAIGMLTYALPSGLFKHRHRVYPGIIKTY